MIRTFIRLRSFEKAWSAMNLTEDDYAVLEDMLLRDPKAGDVIEGSGGIRKIRFALPGSGKSGGARVIYLDVLQAESLYLLYAYPKSAKDDLSKAEIASLKKLVDILKRR